MLTATVIIDPTAPENVADVDGQDEGFWEGFAMQTSPLVALACGKRLAPMIVAEKRKKR